MTSKPNRTLSYQFMLRLPDEMRDQLKQAAESNSRSMNAEIIARLAKSLESEDEFSPAEIKSLIRTLDERSAALQEIFNDLAELAASSKLP